MAETWYPNPAVTQLQHERLVGRSLPSGLLGVPTDPVLVYADGVGTREVRVRADRQAVVQGYGWQNDGDVLTLPALAANASGSTRVDLVVLRLDRSDWSVRVKVVQGTPGAGEPAVTVQTGSSGVWELPLAAVTVASGAVSLAGGTVTPVAWYLSPDGQILCTSTTRPPHERGRRIFESNTSREYISTGTVWLPTAGDAAGTIATFGGFSHDYAVLRRRGGMVTFALTARKASAGLSANTEYRCANVPAGFRPLDHMSTVGIVPSTGSVFTCSVGVDGAVLMNPGGQSIPADRACVFASMTYPIA